MILINNTKKSNGYKWLQIKKPLLYVDLLTCFSFFDFHKFFLYSQGKYFYSCEKFFFIVAKKIFL